MRLWLCRHLHTHTHTKTRPPRLLWLHSMRIYRSAWLELFLSSIGVACCFSRCLWHEWGIKITILTLQHTHTYTHTHQPAHAHTEKEEQWRRKPADARSFAAPQAAAWRHCKNALTMSPCVPQLLLLLFVNVLKLPLMVSGYHFRRHSHSLCHSFSLALPVLLALCCVSIKIKRIVLCWFLSSCKEINIRNPLRFK